MTNVKTKVKAKMHSDPSFNSWKGKIQKRVDKSNKAEQERLARIKAYRIEASRLASMANKRIKRLEERDFKVSPAYDRWLRDGAVKFSVKGKDYNELQREVARMKRFLNATTSTIRGTSRVLKDMAANTQVKYRNMKHLFELAPQFFDLAEKVEEYLRIVDDVASAIGYKEVWSEINKYTETARVDLSSAEAQVASMVKIVGDALIEKIKAPKHIREMKWSAPTSK